MYKESEKQIMKSRLSKIQKDKDATAPGMYKEVEKGQVALEPKILTYKVENVNLWGQVVKKKDKILSTQLKSDP